MSDGTMIFTPSCFASPSFAPNQVLIAMLSGMPPMIGTYKSHDLATITLGNPCLIEIGRDPSNGSISISFAPYGLPFIEPRKERKFALNLIIQVDVCADPRMADGYQKAFNTIQPAKANALDILNANRNRKPFV